MFSHSLHTELMHEYQGKGLAIAESIADSAVDILLNQDAASIQQRLDEFEHISDVGYIVIKDTHDDVVAHTLTPHIPDEIKAFHDAFLDDIKENPEVSRLHINESNTLYLDVMMPILLGELGVVHVGMDISSIKAVIFWSILKIAGLLVALFMLSLVLIRLFVNKLAKPLSQLTHYAKALTQHDFSKPSDMHDDIKALSKKSSDEIGILAKSFIKLEQSLIDYIQQLKTTLVEKSKIENELAIAKSIQEDMLPSSTQLEALSTNCELSAYMRTMKEVGGDFYDVFKRGNNLFLVMGDVSGKGVSAALFMSAAMTFIRSLANEDDSVSDLLFRVNEELCKQNSNQLFVTLFVAKLDLDSAIMSYCNAGHPSPYLKDKNATVSELAFTGGMALGIDDSVYYEEKQLQLKPQDCLLVFTDGISEAMNASDDLYGESRVESCFKEEAAETANDYRDALIASVDNFVSGAEQNDDISLLVFKWQGKESVTIGPELKVHFINDVSEIEKLHYVVGKYAVANELEDGVAMNLNLVLEELLSNTIFYGYDDHDTHYIYVELRLKGDVLTAVIEDDGIPFNPLEREEVDTSRDIDDVEVGGLGIHFVKKLMDKLSYERKDNKNFLTLEKQINANNKGDTK